MGLCESLNLGHRVVSSGTGTTFLLGSGTGDQGVGPKRMLQPSGQGCGEAELPIGSFGRDKGPVPSLGKSRGGGRSIRSLSSEGPAGVPDRGPWGARMETRDQAQLAPCNTHSCKTSCFRLLFSLEASTCNSLELIYIKTIKYDLRYKLTSTKPHIT